MEKILFYISLSCFGLTFLIVIFARIFKKSNKSPQNTTSTVNTNSNILESNLSSKERLEAVKLGLELGPKPGYTLIINIEEFTRKFSKGGIINAELLHLLTRIRFDQTMSDNPYPVYIANFILDDYERRLAEYIESEEALSRTATLNNIGIEAEKEGRIADAIKAYEQNIAGPQIWAACHSFDRLAVLYRKAKDLENEKRVLLKAIEVFDPKGEKPDLSYRVRLQKLLQKYDKVKASNTDN